MSRAWTVEEENYLIENFPKFSIQELAEILNRSYKAIQVRASYLGVNKNGLTIDDAEYSIYKGDKFLFMGTKDECLKYLNVKISTFQRYQSEIYQREGKGNRIQVFKLDDEDG